MDANPSFGVHEAFQSVPQIAEPMCHILKLGFSAIASCLSKAPHEASGWGCSGHGFEFGKPVHGERTFVSVG